MNLTLARPAALDRNLFEHLQSRCIGFLWRLPGGGGDDVNCAVDDGAAASAFGAKAALT